MKVYFLKEHYNQLKLLCCIITVLSFCTRDNSLECKYISIPNAVHNGATCELSSFTHGAAIAIKILRTLGTLSFISPSNVIHLKSARFLCCSCVTRKHKGYPLVLEQNFFHFSSSPISSIVEFPSHFSQWRLEILLQSFPSTYFFSEIKARYQLGFTLQ